jgi:hypothetical protein
MCQAVKREYLPTLYTLFLAVFYKLAHISTAVIISLQPRACPQDMRYVT